MQSSNAPTPFPIPWANSAGSSYIRSVPTASQIGINNGAASLTDGFPPLNFVAVAAGGVPPFGQDVNGILFRATQAIQWLQAGYPTIYNASFSSAIGGYPKGAMLLSADLTHFWISTTDANTTDPDTGGAGWAYWALNYAVDAGAANALVVTLSPAPTALTDGMTITVKPVSTNTGASTINVNSIGSVPILSAAGSALIGGEIMAGVPTKLIYCASRSSWVLIGGANYARLSGSSTQVFNVANAVSATEAVAWGQFTASLGTSGYKIEPNSSSPTGKIITQWGYGTNTSSGVAQAVVFPTTFPTAVLHVFAQEDNPSGTWVTGAPTVHCAGDVTATGFNEYRLSWNGTAWSGGSAAAFRYIAIGN